MASSGRRVVARQTVVTVRDGEVARRPDALAGEEPMEVRVNGTPVSVTMRTPGNDFDLALGFCLTEGIVEGPEQVRAMRYCLGGTDEQQEYNVVDVGLMDRGFKVDESLRRNVYTTSSCGLCGTASIEAVRKRVVDVSDDPVEITTSVLTGFADMLRDAQRVFERTGGLHAAGVFRNDGELICLREDVGRHNAVDKVVGWAATQRRLPMSGHILMVSGRIAFEIVQKALIAGFPMVVAVSAPSSLAVELAEQSGMTLVGFLRGASMNIYTHPRRVLTGGGGRESNPPSWDRHDQPL